jgi:hypothetical protein
MCRRLEGPGVRRGVTHASLLEQLQAAMSSHVLGELIATEFLLRSRNDLDRIKVVSYVHLRL